MQKLIENIPLILLLVLVPYFFYNDPNIAQSIILAAISGLVGYRAYLDSLIKPDYEALFTERLDAKDLANAEAMRFLDTSMKEIREGQSKLAIAKNHEETRVQHKW